MESRYTTFRDSAPKKSVFSRRKPLMVGIIGTVVVLAGLFMVRASFGQPNLQIPAFRNKGAVGMKTSPSSMKPVYKRPGFGVPETRMNREALRVNVGEGSRRNPRYNVDPLFDLFFGGLSGERKIMDVFDELMQLNEVQDTYENRMAKRKAFEEEIERAWAKREAKDASEGIRRPYTETLSEPNKKEIAVNAASGKVDRQSQVPELKKEETPEGYTYTLDTMGVDRENLKLMLQDSMMIVEGRNMVKTADGYHSATFKRSFALPPDANLETLKSEESLDGKLLVFAEKATKAPEPKGIPIERLPSKDEPSAAAGAA
mmetsp:Transcript_13759/g.27837  ORF Transcript_13759/g.27837 Transcript_13759/m.27837 type:complete len:316 (-) Transcript_13759:391-1338(-)